MRERERSSSVVLGDNYVRKLPKISGTTTREEEKKQKQKSSELKYC
jgi:hypothetical protein